MTDGSGPKKRRLPSNMAFFDGSGPKNGTLPPLDSSPRRKLQNNGIDGGFCIFAGDNHFVDANRETSI